MINIYDKNGLFAWTDYEIEIRNMFVNMIKRTINDSLTHQNSAFSMYQIEAPLLMPTSLLNEEYLDSSEVFHIKEEADLVLRPETTKGSYLYAEHLLQNNKRLPLVVWQHGKSFRHEQDKVSKHMRLKEFYQLEFQILYAESTKNDYSMALINDLLKALNKLLPVTIGDSDRLPAYSTHTQDLICHEMEIASISHRIDFPRPQTKVLEIAFGTDRLVYQFLNK